ncbi:MAG: carboxypeptidase regulatory-like domain-containing protein, partial [Calditrichaeota bacterium]|nr:carboxypeptidase regulatory-like domain-containing protein [Calditrichota bacterium]
GFGYERDNLHEAYADYPQAIDVNGVINHINDGVGFINFRGYNNWGNINQYMISELENAWMLPIVTGMVCGTNDFIAAWGDSSPLGRGEAFVRAWNDNAGVGGVACFGPTDLYTRTWFNNALDGEFYYSLFNRGITYLGGLCIAAKIRLISTYPSHLILENGDNVGYYFYTYTLLGDPGMQVRTREPIPIEADYSSNYPAGTTSLDVIVFEDEEPIVGAYVHIYLDDDVRYGAFTDDEGVAVIDVDPLEIGTYLLTVTGQNLIPVLDDFEVIVAEVFLALDEIEIDDDDNDDSDGNGDGIMNPGETIELNITIRNSGSEDSDGANASLSSDSPWIDEITSSEAEYDEIASGQTSAGNQPFVFNLLPATPNGTELNFELRIVSDDNEWKKSFNLSVNGYDFTVVHFLFSDTLLTPGTEQELTIELENTGSINARELSATLYCDHRSVQIRAAESFYEPIASGDTAENNPDIPFEVLVSPNAYNGSEASFGLLLTDETGMSDSLIFTTTLGEPTPDVPQGPDGYGYWAFDNRDTTSGMAPEYEWIEGRTSLNGINDQQGVGDEGSRVLQELPFEFIYYGREYTEITINSNGWMCFGRSDQFSWNNQGMGSAIAPPAMIAPFWTDLWSGEIHTWYDEENARYIIEWREWGGRNGNVTFEVILYDPTVVNTVTGDGEIVFQYETISNSFRDPYPREQATIGICSHNREDLLQITHADIWDERTRGLVSGSVIRFTTGEYTEIGAVFGRVLDIVDGSPLENAWVRIDGTGFFDRTDENGLFRIDNIPIGSYTVIASMRHFNEDLALEIEITDDGETRVPDFELTHPSFNIDREEVIYGLRPDSSGHRVFNIWNDGNGPLDYTIEIDSRAEPPEERDEQWEILFDYNLSDTARTGNWEGDDRDSSYTGDYNLKGVTFDGDYLYVAGAYVRSELPHLIYVINRDGERVRQFEQTSVVERPPTRGYWDIEFNGENLYAIEKDTVIEVNRDGELVRAFLDPHGGSKLITYSREDGKIFTAGITDKEVVEFDADGGEAVVHSVDFNGIFKVYGMSWYPIDPDGFYLYMFVDNISNEGEPRLRIMKY